MNYSNKLGAFSSALGAIRIGCREYSVPISRGISAALTLYLRGQFSLKEIVGYALYVPAIRASLPLLISKERSLARLRSFNPVDDQYKTENKAIFYRLCKNAGIPIPETFCTFRQGTGEDRNGRKIHDKHLWLEYFRANLPAHFIIKDVGGAYASGFGAFERRQNNYFDSEGKLYQPEDFYQLLSRRSGSEIVIQERLFDHPELQRLCGFRGLQTMRVNTHLDAGSTSLLFHMIKVIVKGNTSDNFSMGTTGNLIAFSEAGNDILSGARTLHSCGSGLVTIRRHPETGVSIDGFRIPFWHEAVELARDAHLRFDSFGYLGWDIAITPTGPKIIEANAWWDPPNYAPTIMTEDNWRRIFG